MNNINSLRFPVLLERLLDNWKAWPVGQLLAKILVV
jgi:hypothetical protein